MRSRFPWRDTSEDIAENARPQWETPAGAQEKADKAEQAAKDYSDERLAEHVGTGGSAHSLAVPDAEAGFISGVDQAKLNGIQAGAEINQNAYSVINNIPAGQKEDHLTITAGTGITVTPDPANKEIRITSSGTAIPGKHGTEHLSNGADPIPEATGTISGLMSAADKVALDTVVEDVESLAGAGRTTETVKGNADAIADVTAQLAETVPTVVNAKGYGAKHNTDSTAAIQAAINAAALVDGEVCLPPGMYLISGKLSCPNNVTIVGYGKCELHAIANIDAILDLSGSIKNVYINGNNMANKGIQLTGDYCFLERCVFAYCVYGIYNTHDVHKFINCFFQNCTYGLYSADRFINSFIYGMVAQNNQYGIYITYTNQQPQSLFITHSLFYGNTVRGIYSHKDIFVLCITDCVFDGEQPRAIMLNGLSDNLGADITIKNCYIGGTEVPVWIGAGYGHVVIDSNRIDNGSFRGLLVEASETVRNSDVVITNNTFGNNAGADMEVDSIDGCWIERNGFGLVSGTSIVSKGTFTGSKPLVTIKANRFSAPNRVNLYNVLLVDNIGFVTKNEGVGAVGNTFKSVVVPHGLDITPTKVIVTPQGNLGSVWVSNIGATTFTFNCSTASAGDTIFTWEASR